MFVVVFHVSLSGDFFFLLRGGGVELGSVRGLLAPVRWEVEGAGEHAPDGVEAGGRVRGRYAREAEEAEDDGGEESPADGENVSVIDVGP